MQDNGLVSLVSLSLPDFYKPIIMALQSPADDVSFNVFTSKLFLESAGRGVVNTRRYGGSATNGGAALTAQFPNGHRGRSGGHYRPGCGGSRMASVLCISRSHGIAGMGSISAVSMSKRKCFYCQKEGH